MSDETDERIPAHWYEATESRYVCLCCHKVFSRVYKPRNILRRKKKGRGANMFSLWAWHNFRKHLLKCWGNRSLPGRESSGHGNMGKTD